MTAPLSDIDFYNTATINDPISAYHRMLELGPVVFLPKNNLHAVVGYDALCTVLRQPLLFRSGMGVSVDDNVNKMLIGSTLNSDPPEHDKTRAITFAPLTPKALTAVQDEITAAAEKIAEDIAQIGAFDAATDLAPYLPLTVVRDLLGLGDHGKSNMLSWGAATFELIGDPGPRRDAAIGKIREMRAFLEDPKVIDGLSETGWAKRATKHGLDAGLGEARATELMRDYIAPSLDTTISAIGYAIHLFAKHPEQWDAIRADRRLIKNAIEEIVRLNTPIRAFTRYVNEDTELADIKLQKRSRILAVFGAANRDPSKFPDPDRFDIHRSTRGHVGFGHGVHACLGMHLARAEMSALFNALAERIARFKATAQPKPALNATIHAFASLPMKALR